MDWMYAERKSIKSYHFRVYGYLSAYDPCLDEEASVHKESSSRERSYILRYKLKREGKSNLKSRTRKAHAKVRLKESFPSCIYIYSQC